MCDQSVTLFENEMYVSKENAYFAKWYSHDQGKIKQNSEFLK